MLPSFFFSLSSSLDENRFDARHLVNKPRAHDATTITYARRVQRIYEVGEKKKDVEREGGER